MSELDQLRSLRTDLNHAIGAYIAAAATNSDDVVGQVKLKAKMAMLSRKLQHVTTTPEERVVELGLELCASVAIRIAIDLDLFNIVGDRQRVTITELAQTTGADVSLLSRITRTLVAEEYLSEPAVNVVGSTPMCRAMTQPNYRDWFIINFEVSNKVRAEIPAYIAERGFKDMDDRADDVTSHVLGADFYGYLKQNPKHEATFASSMGMLSLLPPFIQPHYPFKKGILKTDVAMVDIGGGHGQYLNELLEEHPNLPGRFILQDLETVIATADDTALDPRIEKQAYNYFTPQPVIGAEFYIMRAVLHNLTDNECVEILQNLRAAMTPGYSKLLVHEMIMPASGAPRRSALADINMLMLCGKDRTLAQYTDVLKKAGFVINRVYNAPVGSRAIIEAEVLEVY